MTEPIAPMPTIKSVYRRSLLWSTLWVVVLFGIADVNAPFTILAVLGVVFAWMLSVAPQRPASRLAINGALGAVISLAALITLRVGIGVSTFAIFAAMLLVVKLFDLRGPRDDGQVLVLLVGLVVAAILTSNSLLTGLVLLVTGVVLLRAVLRFHIYSAAERGGRGIAEQALPARVSVDMRSFQIATLFFAGAIGTLIFLVLPRNLGASAFGDWGTPSTGSVTGFTDQVELGRPGLISQSPTPVLDLQVFDRNERNIGAMETPAIYLRGAVLTRYNDGRWASGQFSGPNSLLRVEVLRANEPIDVSRMPTQQGWDREYRISLRGGSIRESVIFAPWMPIEFRSSTRIQIGNDKETGRLMHNGMGSTVNYRIRAFNPEFLDVHTPDGYIRTGVRQSEVPGAISELASDIVKDAGLDPDPATRPVGDDVAVVRVLENHLQSKYTYTLQSDPVPPGRDATEWFLLDRREGHCEYYASALVLMARSMGIPARVITGYVASDFDDVTGQYIVRESNAHAWVEAEVGPMKWLTFDGTPRADFQQIHEPKASPLHAITRWYKAIEYAWVKGVIGYDSQSRKKVFGDVSSDLGLLKFGRSMQARLESGSLPLVGKAALVAVAVFGISFALGLVAMRYRSVFGVFLDPIRSLLARWGGRLSERGLSVEQAQAAQLERAIANGLTRAQIQREPWLPLHSLLAGHSNEQQPSPMLSALGHAAGVLYRFRFAPPSSVPDSGEISEAIARLRASEKPGRHPNNGPGD